MTVTRIKKPATKIKRSVTQQISELRESHSTIERLKLFSQNPSVKIIATTALDSAVSILSRRFLAKYPVFISFLKGSLDTIEAKVGSHSERRM